MALWAKICKAFYEFKDSCGINRSMDQIRKSCRDFASKDGKLSRLRRDNFIKGLANRRQVAATLKTLTGGRQGCHRPLIKYALVHFSRGKAHDRGIIIIKNRARTYANRRKLVCLWTCLSQWSQLLEIFECI